MLEKKLDKIAKILLYAAPFLTLIFIQGFYFPFIITRTVFFRELIMLGLSAYFLLLALNFNKYRPRFNWGLALAAIFLLVELIAAAFGLNFFKSFWSDFERMEGVLSLIFLAVYLFLLQIFLREKKDWLFYIRLIIISSVLVSLYGLVQRLNLLPVFEAGVGRVTSTIGNAAFLAGYALIAAGLSVYYYFNEPNKNYRYAALGAAGLNLLMVFLTSTRGAVIGVIAGGAVYLTLNAVYASGRPRKYSLIALLILAAVVAGFIAFRGKLADSGFELIRRLATISVADGTAKNRLAVWNMALKDFKFHPLLGVGRENFEVIYNKYYTPDITENWFDRTHNVYLDELSAGGVFGLLSYLMILAYLFCRLFKTRRSDYRRFAIFTSLLAAYAVHNFFVFDTINTSFLYFFLIGFLGFEAFGRPPADSAAKHKVFNAVFLALIVLNLWGFYRLVYLPLKINRNIYVGYYYVLADAHRSYEAFAAALNYKYGSVEAAVQLNNMYDILENKGGLQTGSLKKYYDLTEEKLRQVAANFPLDLKSKMYLAQLLLNHYNTDKIKFAEAEKLLNDTVKLSPTRVEAYYLLYNLYAKQAKAAAARAVLEDLAAKLPAYGGIKIMLMADLKKDDPKRAEEMYQRGIKQSGYTSFGGLKKIINYLLDQKRYAETVPFYLDYLNSYPARYDYRVDLAKVYYLSGDLNGAVNQINLVNAESPGALKGNEGFVNMLYDAANK